MEIALAAGAIDSGAGHPERPVLTVIRASPGSSRSCFRLWPAAPSRALMGSIHPDDRDRVGKLVKGAVEAGDRYEADYRVTDGAGGWRWVNARGQVERDESGKAVRFPGGNDVTDRKRAEEALILLTAEFGAAEAAVRGGAVDHAPDSAVCGGSITGSCTPTKASCGCGEGLGRGDRGKNCLELGSNPGTRRMHDREIEEVRATKKPPAARCRLQAHLAAGFDDYLLVPVIGADGEVEAVAGTTRT